jgi:hypothetical protein
VSERVPPSPTPVTPVAYTAVRRGDECVFWDVPLGSGDDDGLEQLCPVRMARFAYLLSICKKNCTMHSELNELVVAGHAHWSFLTYDAGLRRVCTVMSNDSNQLAWRDMFTGRLV